MKMHSGILIRDVLIALLIVAALAAGGAALFFADTIGRTGNRMPSQMDYELDKVARTDPALVVYEPAGIVPLKMDAPRAIAVGPDGKVYVGGDAGVIVDLPAPSDDGELAPVPATFAAFGPVECLAVGPGGTIYAGLRDHVEVYGRSRPQDQFVLGGSWPAASKDSVLTSLAADADEVFVADAGKRAVYRYSREGERLGEIAGFSVPSPHFDVAVGKDGLLRVVNPGLLRMEVYTRGGEKEEPLTWGEGYRGVAGFIGCCNPASFAMLPDGGYVTAEKGIRRVKVYDAAGKFVGVVAGHETFRATDPALPTTSAPPGELDVAATPDGRILVLDPFARQVRFFVKKGKAD